MPEEESGSPSPNAMRDDWNRRATEDFRLHIATGHSYSDEDFLASGESDLSELVLDGVELDSEASVLEIGCGVGRLLLPLAKRAALVHGVDISPVMIEKARSYTAGLSNIQVACTDGTLSAVRDASLDLVFSFIVFQHIPVRAAIETYIAEAARTLRPGGVFRFQVDGRWWWAGGQHEPDTYEGIKFTTKSIRRLVVRSGLNVFDEWGADGHYYWITARKPGRGGRVTLRPRGWDRRALAASLGRLGVENPTSYARSLERGNRSLRPPLAAFLQRIERLPANEFVLASYRAFFGSDGDSHGRAYHQSILERRLEDRAALLDTIATSRGFLDLVRPFVVPLHWSVVFEIQERLRAPLGLCRLDHLAEAVARSLPPKPNDAVVRAFQLVLGYRPDERALAHHADALPSREDGAYFMVRSLLTTRAADLLGATPSLRNSERDASVALRVLRNGSSLDHRTFVQLAYHRCLDRPADHEGEGYYCEKLNAGALSRAAFLADILNSSERRARATSRLHRFVLLAKRPFGNG